MDDFLKSCWRKLATIFILLLLPFLLTFSTTATARTFTLTNNCSFPVWFGFLGSSFPKPADGNYRLEANGGKNTVEIPAGGWSGVIAGRTNCTAAGCETADCGGGTGGCTRGFNQPATQAEFTVSPKGTDFYDVEVINGVNLPVSITPSVTANASNPYFCGAPGSTNPSPGMGACSWQLNPPLVEYNWVQNGGAACSSSSTCPSGTVCGISFNPGQTPLLKKTCGKRLGYWTANQICGVQRNYGAPFNCNQNLPAPQNNLTWWHLMACVNVGSCYSAGAGQDCCGCVNWDKIGIPVPPGPITDQCKNVNPNWVKGVQPTLEWLKRACPTAYTYPYDDQSSTFTCNQIVNGANVVNYTITFCPGGNPPPPPTDTGTIKVVVSDRSDTQCYNAADKLFIDQDTTGTSFTVSTTADISKVVGVGSHTVKLTSQSSIPAGSGSCKSTLDTSLVTVTKDKTTTVTATYKFTVAPPPPQGQFSYNVTLGYPFLKVLINSSQSCPAADGNPTCLVKNQASGSTMTIKGQGAHLCNLMIQASGSVVVTGGSNGCFINSTPATTSKPGSISLPARF